MLYLLLWRLLDKGMEGSEIVWCDDGIWARGKVLEVVEGLDIV